MSGVKIMVTPKTNDNEKLPYPCLCQAIQTVLFWARITGILPIISVIRANHGTSCHFVISKNWLIYSYIIPIIYVPYFLITYGFRLTCGPNELNIPEWYVMTLGYFITDFDSIISIICGIIFAKKNCLVLEKVSKMPGSICEMKTLAKTIQILTYSLLILFAAIFCSFLYVAWLRMNTEIPNSYNCVLLDLPIGVILRGISLIFPTIQCLVISLYALLICNKFKHLTETTAITMDRLNIAHPLDSSTMKIVKNGAIYNACNHNNILQRFEQLSDMHQEITYILVEINKCIGFQLLATISSSLYTIVYYLYRYITAPKDSTDSDEHERIHYICGLLYRIIKTTIYMILGRKVLYNSNQPLEVLQRSRIIALPARLQQQVQSLILQWYGKHGYLSSYGIINIGPWLLAPIVGNVITYLLVALQFEGSKYLPTNMTDILGSVF